MTGNPVFFVHKKKNLQLRRGGQAHTMTCEALHLYPAYPKGLSKRLDVGVANSFVYTYYIKS